ncbi:Fe-S cluster assembly protein HesB [Kineosporiaceae bacterium SCSIO 59966]|nr:Fe-S cluster assembly protein HesB [Kineosporiaceae bacterium SCSIO 59966]
MDGRPHRLRLALDDRADELLTRDPFALLVGMLLDQQVPMEQAFAGPARLADRMGTGRLDPVVIADMDPDRFAELMAQPPAVHRYHTSMAARVQALARAVVDEYAGDPTQIWTSASDGAELRARLERLPGFGVQKAKIFTALLGKQLGVRPLGWRDAAGEYGPDDVRMSVADVRDEDSLAAVRETKRRMKAEKKAAGRR